MWSFTLMLPNPPASAATRPIIGGGSFLVGYQLKEKHVLVIGGGKEAANRTFFALDADAFVTVISPGPLHPAVEARHRKGLLRWINRDFQDSDLEMEWETETSSPWPVDMVLGCIDDHVESRRIALLCRSKRIPVNCADIPELCDFYFMAQFRQEQLQIAVSTNGGGPRLGVRIRNAIVEKLDPNTPKAVTMIGKLREQIRKVDDEELKRFGTNAIESRMGWVSRFCDSWTLKQLTTLDNPQVMQEIIDCFKSGKAAPESTLKDEVVEYSNLLPATLTSYWWCPRNMGYFAWIKMFARHCFNVGFQITRLMLLHVKLPFRFLWQLPFLKPKLVNPPNVPVTPVTTEEVITIPTTLKRRSLKSTAAVQTQDSVPIFHQSTQAVATTQENFSQSEVKLLASVHSQATTVVANGESQTVSGKELQYSETHQLEMAPETASLADTETQTIETSVRENLGDQLSQQSDETLGHTKSSGKIYLVGAGPGHPDMLTVQALNLLKTADLIVSDRLIPQEILDLIPKEKLILSSFKVGGASDKAQDESNEICLHAVQQGKNVVRLKTGDPFVFGRGGEEILFFRHYDIEPVVVPGLSSVFAAPTMQNIPVTHREVADQVLLLSGRGKGGSFPYIPHFYANRTTIFLMSLSRVEELAKRMIAKDYPHDIPCAVIEKGTWKVGERVSYGTLDTIGKKAKEDGMENPAMLIVGDVISVLHHKVF
jgi:uroporphyrin-III C-methyltransferase